MKKNQILCFLLIMLLILPTTACNLLGTGGTGTDKKIDTNEKEIVTINGQEVTSQREEEKPKKSETPSQEKETETPSEAELINIIHVAETALLKVCADGFDAEFHGMEKKEFKEVSPGLLKYYTKDYLYPTWKDFYENHLGEWGYGMGELFIFADYNTAKDCFVEASSENGQIKVRLNYNVGSDEYYGSEGEKLEYTYVLIPADGKWLINEILYKQQ